MCFSPFCYTFVKIQHIEKLKKLNVESISLSLDSYNPLVHDEIRGKEKTFKKTIELSKIIKSFNINLQINTLIFKENINSYLNLFKT
ncbi:MAG: radical SAM protein [bacterium]